MDWLSRTQGWIHQSVRDHLLAFAAGSDWAAFAAIFPLGMLFGMIHALTPGHSKTLLATYLVGSELSLIRGLSVSMVLSAMHVLSAILIALFATGLLSRGMTDAGSVPVAEWVSRGALVLIGLWMAVQAVRGLPVHPRHEGTAFGFLAGLVPCPLTLFVMVMASAKGIPLAGLAFAAAMFAGIATTLAAVASLAITGRTGVKALLARYGAPLDLLSRGLALLGGMLLMATGLYELSA
ncbi:ABC transporter permease [Parvibaculum sp.]|uniref:HoxN/HupN/NixA family nickel/cobalt transporter n=1 Tax=Parvibaculum sp. TaxID=2024848 RepID=UPI00391CEE8E